MEPTKRKSCLKTRCISSYEIPERKNPSRLSPCRVNKTIKSNAENSKTLQKCKIKFNECYCTVLGKDDKVNVEKPKLQTPRKKIQSSKSSPDKFVLDPNICKSCFIDNDYHNTLFMVNGKSCGNVICGFCPLESTPCFQTSSKSYDFGLKDLDRYEKWVLSIADFRKQNWTQCHESLRFAHKCIF